MSADRLLPRRRGGWVQVSLSVCGTTATITLLVAMTLSVPEVAVAVA
jgi:hypothetical protein